MEMLLMVIWLLVGAIVAKCWYEVYSYDNDLSATIGTILWLVLWPLGLSLLTIGGIALDRVFRVLEVKS